MLKYLFINECIFCLSTEQLKHNKNYIKNVLKTY